MNTVRFNRVVALIFLLAILTTASGCAAVAGIFKAGVWVGVIMVVLIVGAAAALFSRLR